MTETTTAWKPHALCMLFPMMGGSEFELFKADIEKNGQRDPIVMIDDFVLDGQNRLRACIELGIEPKTTWFDGDDPVSFVLSKNLSRRHLKPGQRATIVALATDWNNAAAAGRPAKDGNNSAPVQSFETTAERAAKADVSVRTQSKADRVAKASPDLAAQVRTGEIELNDAVQQVAPAKTEPGVKKAATTGNAAAQVTALIADLARITEERDHAISNAADLAAQMEDVAAIRDGDEAKRMAVLRAELRGVKATRDTLIAEKAQLVIEVKRLNKKLGKVGGK